MTDEEKAQKNTEDSQNQEAADAQDVQTEETPTPAKAERKIPRKLQDWKPKTELGEKVFKGKITDIDHVFQNGIPILESEIVDMLLPNVDNDIILIGGTPGKGGGIRRIAGRRTSRMHKSGRRLATSVMAVVGNKDGYVGIGVGKSTDFRDAAQKATRQAKLNLIPMPRGCGSWECGCRTQHTIPMEAKGKCGSVEVTLRPAPKGVGLVASDEIKKILGLAGLKDIWVTSRGQTQTRINHITATFNALKKLNRYKVSDRARERCAVKIGSSLGE